MLIIKNIFQKITSNKPINFMDLNIDTAFKMACAGFIKLKKITYMVAEAKKPIFKEIKLIRLDILFVKGDQYAILQLQQNKTDIKHTGIQIILIATSKPTYPISALKKLFT